MIVIHKRNNLMSGNWVGSIQGFYTTTLYNLIVFINMAIKYLSNAKIIFLCRKLIALQHAVIDQILYKRHFNLF